MDMALRGVPVLTRTLKFRYAYQLRVASYDPALVYQRLNVNAYRRHQVDLKFADAFPARGTECSCGCGQMLPKRRRRWASDDCLKFALDVWSIVDGQTDVIKRYAAKCFGRVCVRCRCRKGLKVDHVVPVSRGGGGCWLSNFQVLCHACHVQKTNEDFGRGSGKQRMDKAAA